MLGKVMENARERGKERGINGKTGGKSMQVTLNEYEMHRDCIVAENNEKLLALSLPPMGSNVHVQQRPKKIAKIIECTKGVSSGNHSLRFRSRRNIEDNVDEDPTYYPEEDPMNAVEEETPAFQKKKDGRGITLKLNIISRQGQPKIKITLNEFGQPVGIDSKEFASVVGTFVRKKISLACDDWRDIDIVMWGRTYTRQRRARDARRAAARTSAAGEAAINAVTEAAVTTRMQGRSVTSG